MLDHVGVVRTKEEADVDPVREFEVGEFDGFEGLTVARGGKDESSAAALELDDVGIGAIEEIFDFELVGFAILLATKLERSQAIAMNAGIGVG
mgnify:FL=1